MEKYRIKKEFFSYTVQMYTLINYDGILDYDWKDLKSFNSKEDAEKYIKLMKK